MAFKEIAYRIMVFLRIAIEIQRRGKDKKIMSCLCFSCSFLGASKYVRTLLYPTPPHWVAECYMVVKKLAHCCS